ncbi:MAG: hypothetical protein J6P95_06565 [Paludibacteraceae bacterium]|nr:hypothetical protein [Paludibacteraceae bacterium]
MIFCLLASFSCLQLYAVEEARTDSLHSKKSRIKKNNDQIYYGFSTHLDLASPVITPLANNLVVSAEAAFDVNLLQKYFPIVEVGYTYVNKHDSIHEVNYKTSAPFFRLGINYSLMKTKTKEGEKKVVLNYPYIGLRYGFTVMKHQLEGVTITDKYWGENAPLAFPEKLIYVGWLELVAGVRVAIAKSFTMGWNVRIGLLPHASGKNVKNQLWYIPGFGKTSNTPFMFNYTIGYTFRTKKDK